MSTRIKHWLWGLGSSLVGGAATSLTATLGAATAHGLGMDIPTLTWKQIGVVALSGAFWTTVAYLKQSPLPPEPTGNTEIITKPKE